MKSADSGANSSRDTAIKIDAESQGHARASLAMQDRPEKCAMLIQVFQMTYSGE